MEVCFHHVIFFLSILSLYLTIAFFGNAKKNIWIVR